MFVAAVVEDLSDLNIKQQDHEYEKPSQTPSAEQVVASSFSARPLVNTMSLLNCSELLGRQESPGCGN